MNDYAALALLGAAQDGKAVAVISSTHNIAREAFNDFARLAGDEVGTTRTNGQERILYPTGGDVRFTTHRSHRPLSEPDIVFVDWDVEMDDHEFTWTLHRAYPNAEIVRA